MYKLYLSSKMPLFRITLKFERHIVVILCTNLCYFKLYCTICSVLRIICGREREHSFFCMRFLLSKENGESCILCCIPGGFFKKFSTPHVIHCKKMCGLSVPSQDVKHSLNYYIIFGPGSA